MKTSELIFYTVTAIALVAVVPSSANAEEPPSTPNIQQYLTSQGVGQQNPMNTEMNNLLVARSPQEIDQMTNTGKSLQFSLEQTDPKPGPYGTDTLNWNKIRITVQ